MIRKGLDEVA